MAVALVKFVQGATIGTAGVALIGVDGTSVTVSNGASNAGILTWTFTVIAVPSNSSVPLGVAQTGATSTWAFTPDVAGCFIIALTTTDGSGGTASDVRAFGVLTTAGLLIPAFTGDNNSLNFGGQPTGWDVYMEAWLRQLETLLDGSFAAPPTSIQTLTGAGAIVASGAIQPVALNTATASFTASMPTSPSNGQQIIVFDPTKQWAALNAKLSVGAGVSIENPAALGGAYVTNGTLTLPAVNGASYTYLWVPGSTLWKII